MASENTALRSRIGAFTLLLLTLFSAMALSAVLIKTNHDSAYPSPSSTVSLTHSVPFVTAAAQSQNNPVVVGWGGSELQETSPSVALSTNPLSQVFPGEMASDMEMQVRTLSTMGLNTIRVGFESACTRQKELGPYSSATFQRAINITRHYDFWLVMDYHGYSDLERSQSCWLSFWNGVVSQFRNSYDKIVWEPINEPTGTVSTLSSGYQAWLNQARSLGDSHWVVVENCLSNGCLSSFTASALANGYPAVNDTMGRVFISLHPYYFYDQSYTGIHNAGDPATWNNNTADQAANVYYQGVLAGMQRTGWPAISTEGGAVYFSTNNCSITTISCTPPDWVVSGDAGYSRTSLHFMQTLTNLFDSNQPQRINWLWWPAGNWPNSPASVPLTEGAITPGSIPPMWGTLLSSRPANDNVPQNHPPILQAPRNQNSTVDIQLYFQVNASDTDTPSQKLTLFCDNCASFGATFPNVTGTSPVHGTFTWIPNAGDAGKTFNATFTAADSEAITSATVEINVSQKTSPPYDNPPVLVVPETQNVTIGDTLSFTVYASDHDSPPQPLTLRCENCATLGATFTTTPSTSPVNGAFSWTPTASQPAGNFNATFTVTDGNNTSTGTVTIQVIQQPKQPPPAQPPPQQPCLTCIARGWYSIVSTELFWLVTGGTALILTALTAVAFRRRSRKRTPEKS